MTTRGALLPDPAALTHVRGGSTYLWNNGRLFVLDPPGSVVWSLLDGSTPLDDVIDQVTQLHDASPARIEADVRQFIDNLLSQGLVGPASEMQDPPPEAVRSPARGPGAVPRDRPATSSGLATVGPHEALGFRFEISTSDAALRTALAGALLDMQSIHPCVHHYAITRTASGAWDIHLDGLGLRTVATRDQAFRHVLWHVNSETLRSDQSHAIVHAGAVAIAGRGLILPGAINAGKTTLTAGLCMDGAAALSDEFAAVRIGTTRLDAYPRPFNLAAGSWQALGLDPRQGITTATREGTPDLLHVAPSQLPRGAVVRSAPVSGVLFCRYDPNTKSELSPVDRMETTELLLQHCMNLHHMPRNDHFATLVDLALEVPAFRLTFSSLRDGVGLVRSVAT